jgi:hypothetical protein
VVLFKESLQYEKKRSEEGIKIPKVQVGGEVEVYWFRFRRMGGEHLTALRASA